MNENDCNTDIMRARHSVRSYTDQALSADVRKTLQQEIDACNAEGKLHMTLVCDEPQAFDSTMAHYGKFSNVRNYLIIAGKPAADLEERAGYYGERIVLLAQSLGLKSCWVGMTFKKRFVKKALEAGEKLVIVVSLGYSQEQGASHKVKTAGEVSNADASSPAWFKEGIKAALLAPTAMNQQKFMIELQDSADGKKPVVSAKSLGGFFSNVDLGIVKLHFELGAGTDNFSWK